MVLKKISKMILRVRENGPPREKCFDGPVIGDGIGSPELFRSQIHLNAGSGPVRPGAVGHPEFRREGPTVRENRAEEREIARGKRKPGLVPLRDESCVSVNEEPLNGTIHALRFDSFASKFVTEFWSWNGAQLSM